MPINLLDQEIKLVCFDLGGVLVNISSTWNEAAARANVSTSLTSPLRIADLDLLAGLQDGSVDEVDYAQQLAGFLGVSEIEAMAIHDAILIGEYAGAIELVALLHEAGIQTGCLSNTNARHWRRMRSEFPSVRMLGIPGVSDELKLAKPSSEIYRVYERLALMPAESVMFFDDTLENVAAAKNCNWKAQHINGCDPIGQMRRFLFG